VKTIKHIDYYGGGIGVVVSLLSNIATNVLKLYFIVAILFASVAHEFCIVTEVLTESIVCEREVGYVQHHGLP
jgi:hypothetical protein